MSIFKYIMRPFVEFKEEEKKSNSLNEPKPPSSEDSKSSSIKENEIRPVTDTTHSTLDPSLETSAGSMPATEYKKHFENLIEEANAKNPLFQGTDFKEFIDSKMDVAAITDEESRYKTAFNVLKRTGLTKQRLVSTAQEYVNLIENDLKGFNEAFVQQYKTEVELKEALLKKKAAELQTFNEKIAALNKEIKQMSGEIIDSRDKLNFNKNAFMLAGENKKTELKTELQKIDKYFT